MQEKQKLRLNVGCGGSKLEGFINLDANACTGCDIVHDITPRMNWDEHDFPYKGCLPFDNDTVDEIRAWSILEHIRYHHCGDVIRDFLRVLRPGGRLDIVTPDLDAVVQQYVHGKRGGYLPFIQTLGGCQTECVRGSSDWIYEVHMSVFNFEWLYNTLVWWGAQAEYIMRLPHKDISEMRVEAFKR